MLIFPLAWKKKVFLKNIFFESEWICVLNFKIKWKIIEKNRIDDEDYVSYQFYLCALRRIQINYNKELKMESASKSFVTFAKIDRM